MKVFAYMFQKNRCILTQSLQHLRIAKEESANALV